MQSRHQQQVYIATEHCDGSDLKDLCKELFEVRSTGGDCSRLPEIARSLMWQLLYGLHYLHRHSVIHKDLKPENVMYRQLEGTYILKIVDFGLAEWSHDVKRISGTQTYMPPEACDPKFMCRDYDDYVRRCQSRQIEPFSYPYGSPFDVWAAGVGSGR